MDLLTALTVVFVVLKIIGYIDWSWWWVLAPTWISIAVAIVVLGLWFIASLISEGSIQPPRVVGRWRFRRGRFL